MAALKPLVRVEHKLKKRWLDVNSKRPSIPLGNISSSADQRIGRRAEVNETKREIVALVGRLGKEQSNRMAKDCGY